MGSDSGAGSGEPPARPPADWQKRVLLTVLVLVVLVIGYFVGRELLPSWWSRRMAGLTGGSTGWGIWWGLLFGFVATALPLFVLRQIVRDRTWKARGWLALAALLLAAPNLLTLGVVLAGGSAEHRLVHRSPALSTSSLIGAVLAAIAFVGLQVYVGKQRRQRSELSKLRVDEKLRRAEQ